VVRYALAEWFGGTDIEREILGVTGFDGVRLDYFSNTSVDNGKPGIEIGNSPWREAQTLGTKKTKTNYKSRANTKPIGPENNENMRPKKISRNVGLNIQNQKPKKKRKTSLAAPVVEKVSKLSLWNHQLIIQALTY
jgi:hypothetical protein